MRCCRLSLSLIVCAMWVILAHAVHAGPIFQSGELILSRSVYAGYPALITVGQALPGGGKAIADGTYPYVFNNATPDSSFGVTSPIYLDALDRSGKTLATLPIPTNLVNTSFPSKSELSLSFLPNATAVTFMAYVVSQNQLDASNSNTPNHVDSFNPVTALVPRAVAEVDLSGNVTVTSVNAYSGNNGRGAVLVNGNYFMAGNSGNSGKGVTGAALSMLSDNTGVQMIPRGSSGDTTVVGLVNGVFGSSTGYQRGFSMPQVGLAADKTSKDDNFRGLAVFNNTLYVSKGSGSNGVGSVYQVGTGGSFPTLANAGSTPITILPGFPVNGSKDGKDSTGTVLPIYHPFGIWFANADNLYVGDEGGATANDPTSAPGGLERWIFSHTDNMWHLAYTLQNGLNLGVPYTVSGYPTGINPVTGLDWSITTGGLRDITGVLNDDGTVTIYGITSTISGSGDQGADPNELVAITDHLAFRTPSDAAGDSFTVLRTAAFGEVLRGVAYVDLPEPATLTLFGLLGAFLLRRRRQHNQHS